MTGMTNQNDKDEMIHKLGAEIEQLRVQLAGCLMAAEGSREAADVEPGDYAYSVAMERTVVLRASLDQRTADYERACQTIAAMHQAAVGEVTGPRRGVVEDVVDLRHAAGALVIALRRSTTTGEIMDARAKLVRALGSAFADLLDESAAVAPATPTVGAYEAWSRFLLSGHTGVLLGDLGAAKFSRLCTALAQAAPQGPKVTP